MRNRALTFHCNAIISHTGWASIPCDREDGVIWKQQHHQYIDYRRRQHETIMSCDMFTADNSAEVKRNREKKTHKKGPRCSLLLAKKHIMFFSWKSHCYGRRCRFWPFEELGFFFRHYFSWGFFLFTLCCRHDVIYREEDAVLMLPFGRFLLICWKKVNFLWLIFISHYYRCLRLGWMHFQKQNYAHFYKGVMTTRSG